jgi:uncharacterized membrane protein
MTAVILSTGASPDIVIFCLMPLVLVSLFAVLLLGRRLNLPQPAKIG